MFSFFLSKENYNFKLNIKYNIFMKSFHIRSKNIEVSSLLSISTQSSFPSSPFHLITQQYLKYLVQIYRALLTQINFQLFRLHSIINEMHPRLTYRKLCKSVCRMHLATLSQRHVAYGGCRTQLNLFRQADRSGIYIYICMCARVCVCVYVHICTSSCKLPRYFIFSGHLSA